MPRPKKEKPNRSDGLYEVKITIGKNIDGSLIRKSFYSATSKEDAKKQAEEYKIAQAVAKQTNSTFIEKETNFGDWARKYLSSVAGTVKDSTYDYTYRNNIEKHIIPYFGKSNISDIKQIHVKEFFNKMSNDYSKETLKKMRLCLNGIFESAVDNELLSRNPCRNIRLKEDSDTLVKSVYTQAQRDLVLDFANTHRYGLEIIMLLRLGLRRGELLGIQWDDIDFENNILHVQRSVADVKDINSKKMIIAVDRPKTAYSIRDIPIPNDISSKLKLRPRAIVVGENKHKKRPGVKIETKYVFYNRNGDVCGPRTWSRRHYNVFMEEMHAHYLSQEPPVDVPALNPHELRHTCATLLVNSGKSLFAIASMMGWGDLKMLRQRYAHSDIESIRSSLDL